jgi:hypothetical protein
VRYRSIVTVAYGVHRNSDMQLVALAMYGFFTLFTIYNIIYALQQQKKQHWLCVLPLSFCICAIVLDGPLTNIARDIVESWALPKYEKIVEEIQSGKIPISTNDDNLIPPKTYSAPLVYDLFAKKSEDQNLVVEFMTEGGFPALHAGYMFSASDEVSPIIHHWPEYTKIKKNWFFVSK